MRLSLSILSIFAVALLFTPGTLWARSVSSDPNGAPTASTTSCELDSCGERGAASDPNGSSAPSTFAVPGAGGEGSGITPAGVTYRSSSDSPFSRWLTWLQTFLAA